MTVLPVVKVGLIGDVHAEDERLAIALAHFRAVEVHAILCTGDVVDGLGDVGRACDLLRRAGALVVRGNHDRWIATGDLRTLPNAHVAEDLDERTRAMIAVLPPTRIVHVASGKLLLCHGVGANDMQRLRSDTFGYDLEMNDELAALRADRSIAFVVGGHTHEAMVRKFPREGAPPLVVINAGTLARNDDSVFGVRDLRARTVRFHPIADDLTVGAPRIESF